MSKLPTMYIPIVHKDQKHQMLSTKRIKEITKLLPTREEIDAHLAVERKLIKEVGGYTPEPYKITIEKDEYNNIQSVLKNKIPGYHSEVIYLMVSSKGAPIIKILSN
jgi:cell division protein FtsI/penicillin-binding protein 2